MVSVILSLFFSTLVVSRPSLPRDASCQTTTHAAYPAFSTGYPPSINTTGPGTNGTSIITAGMRWLPDTQIVRGVNLGSQFIIEPWMTYDEFDSMGCGGLNDEWSCVQKLGQNAANAAFAKHWDTWITQEDIAKIASLGLNVVRIPVGFWIREDLVQPWEYYPRGGLAYLDRLVGWAADAGLYVIVDLHGGSGSQAKDQQFTGHVSKQKSSMKRANQSCR